MEAHRFKKDIKITNDLFSIKKYIHTQVCTYNMLNIFIYKLSKHIHMYISYKYAHIVYPHISEDVKVLGGKKNQEVLFFFFPMIFFPLLYLSHNNLT